MKLLKSILFHRITMVLIAFVLQILLLVAGFILFQDYLPYFYGASIFLSVIAAFIILNDNSNPAYKIAWLIPILLLPVFGGIFYFVFGRSALDKSSRKRLQDIFNRVNEVITPNQKVLDQLALDSVSAANQSRYMRDYDQSPVYVHTQVDYLAMGEIKFQRMIEELEKAERYIFFEYFIIQPGLFWDTILEVLVRKAKQGVDVRVIYDAVGCLLTLPAHFDKTLENMGIKCAVFNPIHFIFSSKPHHRDHRKILVIDGHTAFTGGINLADEYINKFQKHGHWKDTAVVMKGDAAWGFTVLFLAMWDFIRGNQEDFLAYAPANTDVDAPLNDKTLGQSPLPFFGFVQPYSYNPVIKEPVAQIVYLNLINKATKSIYITSPYLIIDNEMVTALTSAAKSGVDVRIITPHVPDKWFVHALTQSYYKVLTDSGVRIYEYTPGFIHSKSFVVDDEYAVIGTINLDYRSLFLHFECAVWLYQVPCIKDMTEDFLATIALSELITLEQLDKIKPHQKIVPSILRIFAPLM